MKIKEDIKKLKNMDASKLQAELLDAEKKFATTSLKVKAGKEQNYSLISKYRKEVARIKTLINEKISE